MGFIKKKKDSVKPARVKEHKKSATKSKLFHNAALPDKIPPVIQEAATEDDISSNYQERKKENPVGVTDSAMKIEHRQDRTHSDEKRVDSGTINSYNISESSHGSRQNGNNISLQNRVISRTDSVPNSIHSSGRKSSVQSLTVIREQYCCCSKWTTCERILGATVGIMALIIVILLVVIGVLSSNRSQSNFSGLTLTS